MAAWKVNGDYSRSQPSDRRRSSFQIRIAYNTLSFFQLSTTGCWHSSEYHMFLFDLGNEISVGIIGVQKMYLVLLPFFDSSNQLREKHEYY